jgi:hypothetical protein
LHDNVIEYKFLAQAGLIRLGSQVWVSFFLSFLRIDLIYLVSDFSVFYNDYFYSFFYVKVTDCPADVWTSSSS